MSLYHPNHLTSAKWTLLFFSSGFETSYHHTRSLLTLSSELLSCELRGTHSNIIHIWIWLTGLALRTFFHPILGSSTTLHPSPTLLSKSKQISNAYYIPLHIYIHCTSTSRSPINPSLLYEYNSLCMLLLYCILHHPQCLDQSTRCRIRIIIKCDSLIVIRHWNQN